jgi:cell division protein FtsB
LAEGAALRQSLQEQLSSKTRKLEAAQQRCVEAEQQIHTLTVHLQVCAHHSMHL